MWSIRKTRDLSFLVTLLVLAVSMTAPIFGQDDDEYQIELDLGYRWKAGFRGSEDLYRSQLDLGEGPKLFGANLFFAPAEGKDQYFDRLEMRLDNWGGEPYNTAQVRMAKNGLYDLNFFYQNYAYFNSIPSFANPLLSKGSLESQHKQDVSHRTYGFDLQFRPGKNYSPFISYQRVGRFGPVKTTITEGGDDFLLQSDLDWNADDLRGGILFSFPKLSLLVEQGGIWYRDNTTFSASGFQQGNSSRKIFGRDIYLDDYEGQNDFRSRVIPYSAASLTYQPIDEIALKGKISYSMADTRIDFRENSSGNFFSFPELRAFYSGSQQHTSGIASGPSLMVDVGGEFKPADWILVTERFRSRRFHVSGSSLSSMSRFNVDPLLSSRIIDRLDTEIPLYGFIGMDLDIQELMGQLFVNPNVAIRVGHRFERKTMDRLDSFGYDRNVVIVGASYMFNRRNRIIVDYERGRTDQAIMRTDPVDFDRVKVQGRFSPIESLEISGSVTLFDHQNDVLDYFSDNRGYSLQLTYTPNERMSFTGQWDRTDIDTAIPYVVPQTFEIDRFTYRELGNYGNFYMTLMLIRNSQLSMGYSVWGNSGNVGVNYHQPFARFEVPIGERMVGYGQWNYYDYNEKIMSYPQDYQTHMAVLGVRVTLGK
ncbi:MAG: hypothetical protein JSU96_01560 [Acidobacteriota bacterium]|nr:MAG: hypothetical protein JSU96_01560 [Acidobacteriota bacterium]